MPNVFTETWRLDLYGRGRRDLGDVHPLGRILSRVAGGAERELFTFAAGFLQSFQRKVRQRVRADVLADLFHALISRDELLLRGRVHTVETRRDGRRTRDAHVDFFRSRAAHHANDLAASRAAHDGVVDQDDALSFEQAAYRVQLQLHPEVTHRLLGFDEGAAYVVVADQSETKRDSALCGEAHGSGNTAVRDRHDNVCVHRRFLRQLATLQLTADHDRTSEDCRIGTREINVFENARGLRRRGRIEARLDALGPDHDHLAWLYVAFIRRADQVECAGFGSKHDGVFALTFFFRDPSHR